MKEFNYTTSGTCSKMIHIALNDDDTIRNIYFIGGCNGNLKGIAELAKGQKPEAIIARLKGISCGGRPTSCPDQLACALEGIIKGEIPQEEI
ncbi:MAG: TIGR03905 family TSCPD domain-containing protein [Bacteroidales bacterium]|nr:TIGR03905 family TSCPD domain-containing protein [Bacteroidales bacterium]